MGSAQGSSGGAATTHPRSVGRAGAPRTVRTLVALLGVSCLALTAAVADPAGPGAATALTAGVFAAGPGGLGALDTSAAGLPVDDRLVPPTASTPPGGGPVGVDDRGDPLLATVEIADLGIVGDEVLASVIPSALTGSIPAATLRAYRAAAEVLAREDPGCRVDWALLAAIGRIESSHGRFAGSVVGADGRSVPPILGVSLDGSLAGTMVIRDTDGGALDGDTAYDRALGPMQFLPGTWRGWGSDGDRDGRQDPQDIDDAALAAARYLCAGAGGLDRPGPAAAAVRRYNNSTEYVNRVLATAASYRAGGPGAFPDGAGSGWYGPTGDGPTGPSGSTSGDRTTRTPATTPTTATSPTPSPTSSPSPTATTGPSVRPEPTSSPEPSPTGTPTPSATDSPTGEPTGTPTRQPTGEPTGQPTSEPTGQPTGEPTAGPSGEPTGEPSGEPTGGPAPTVSPDPTCETTSASDGEPAPTSCTTDACGTASGDDAAGGVTVEPSSADQPAATCEPAAPASPDPTG